MSNADFYNGKNFYISVTKKTQVKCIERAGAISNVIALNF